MTDAKTRAGETLRALGADFSRWPKERAADGRRLLVGDLGFRAAFESERRLDGALGELRDDAAQDTGIAAAAERVRGRVSKNLRRGPFAGLKWQRIAAAMVVAGMLGGAVDLAFVDHGGGAVDLVMLDPLLEGADAE